jgi:hypothetical protein
VLKVSYLRDNDTWSESRIYFTLVWLLVVWSAIILLIINGFRTGPMIWSVLLFGTASVIAISDQWDNIKELFGL